MIKRILTLIIAELLILGQITPVMADTNEVFVQTDWSGGVEENATHPTDKTGWTKYSGKDANVDTSQPGKITLSAETLSTTETSDTDFTKGTRDEIDISGTGDSASLVLQNDVNDPFVTNVGQWTSLPAVPEMGEYSAFVKAGNYIYCLWNRKTFARFSITAETWEFLAETLTPISYGAALGYEGTGDIIYATRGCGSKEFWKYSIQNNTWTRLADTLFNVGAGGSLAVPGDGYVYCIAGNQTARFMRYSISGNSWVELSTASGNVGRGGNLVYPGLGDYLYLTFDWYSSAFSRYKFKGTSPGNWGSCNGWAGGGLSYPGTDDYIYAWRLASWKSFARFSLTSQTWQGLQNIPANLGQVGIIYYPGSGTKLKFLSQTNYTKPFSFDLNTLRWDEPEGYWDWIGEGARMCYDGSNYIYLDRGYAHNSYRQWQRYSLVNKAWQSLTLPPLYFGAGCDLVYDNGYVYVLRGAGFSDFYRYNVTGDSWETLATTPAVVSHGGALVKAGSYFYAFQGGNTNKFWRYSYNAWDDLAVADAPANVYDGGALCYPGTGDFIYASRGDHNKTFWKYSISGNSWSACADAPFKFKQKGTLMYPGTGDYIYVIPGDYSHYHFGRYKFQGSGANTWEVLESTPFWQSTELAACAAGNYIYADYYDRDAFFRYDISAGTWDENMVWNTFSPNYGSVVYAGGDAYMFYGSEGNGTKHFWKFNLAQRKWRALLKAPFYIGPGTKAVYPGSGSYIYVLEGRHSNKFWAYDFGNNAWSDAQAADVVISGNPIRFFRGAQLDGSGDVLYACQGVDPVNTDLEKSSIFLKYTISTKTWEQKANLPTYISDYNLDSNYRRLVDGNVLVYVPLKNRVYWRLNRSRANAFYAYDTIANSWTTLTAVSGAGNGCSLYYPGSGDFIYYQGGDGSGGLWKYSMTDGTWTLVGYSPLNAGYGGNDGNMFYPGSGDFLYICDGYYGFFARYDFNHNKWDLPVGLSSYYLQKSGSSICALADGDTIYACGYREQFYKYSIKNRTSTRCRHPLYDGSLKWNFSGWLPQLVYPGSGNYIYATRGVNYNTFVKYNIDGNYWEILANAPANFGEGHVLAATPNKVYALRGGLTTTFWEYDIAAKTWTAKSDVPQMVKYGAAMEYPGSGDYIYATTGNNTACFFKYKFQGTNADTWTQLADVPVTLGGVGWRVSDNTTGYGGASMVYPGKGDYLYLVQGTTRETWAGGTASFFRYKFQGAGANTWENVDTLPMQLSRPDGKLVYPGSGNYIYLKPGYGFYPLFSFLVFKDGTYTSEVREIGKNKAYDIATWDTGADGFFEFKARSADNSSMIGATDWGGVSTLSKGGDLSSLASVTDGHKYFQYQMKFYTDDLTKLPQLNSLTLNYGKYPNEQKLYSSIYDSTAARNRLMKLSWSETTPSGTDVKLQLRTSIDGTANWTEWLGPYGTTAVSYDFSNASDYAMGSQVKIDNGAAHLAKDLEDFQYKQAVTVDNTGLGAGTNVVVELKISSANEAFWSHIKSGGEDIRFYDGTQKLSYKITYFDYTSKSATINIKIPSISANEIKTIYLLYGSQDAISESYAGVLGMTTGGLDCTFYAASGYSPSSEAGMNNYMTNNIGSTYGTTTLSSLNTSGQNNNPLSTGTDEYYALYARGYLYCPTTGNYYFRVGSDNYSDLHIDGPLSATEPGSSYFVVSANVNTQTSPAVYLTQGYHTFVYRMQETTGGDWYLVEWLKPGDSVYSVITGTNYYRDALSDIPTYIAVPEEQATSPTLGANWPYRETITLTNDSGSQVTDAVIKITLDKDHTGFWSRIQNDGDDVRFVDSDNTTLLSYKLDSFAYTDKTATFWIKVPSVPPGTKAIYMYYGALNFIRSESDPTVAAVPTNGLVGWYKFNEGSGSVINDSSTAANNGTLIGGSWTTDAKSGGRALSFAGSGYVTLNGVGFNIAAGAYNTIAFWMKWNGSDGVMPWGKSSPSTDLYIQGGWIGYNTGNSERYGPSSSGLSGSWHHITCIVYNGVNTNNKIYIDGVYRAAAGPGAGYTTQLGTSLQISGWPGSYYFQGILDEFVLYNRALSDAEITALYNQSGSSPKLSTSASTSEESATSSTLGANWPYRKPITVTNTTANNLTNEITSINLDASHTAFWNHVLRDGDDIRFIDADNTTKLSYYLAAFDYAAQTATINVKIPSIQALGSKTIYLYYGNTNGGSASDASVYTSRENFDGVSLDTAKWEGVAIATNASVAGGVLTLTSPGQAWSGPTLSSKFKATNNVTVACRARVSQTGSEVLDISHGTGNRKGLLFMYNGQWRIYTYLNGSWGERNRGGSAAANTWYKIKMEWLPDFLKVTILNDNDTPNWSTTVSMDPILTAQSFDFSGTSGSNSSGTANYDYIEFSPPLFSTIFTDIASFSYTETANTYSSSGVYATSNPVIQPILGALYKNDLGEFQEVATKPSGTEIKYQVSKDGYNWYWWNGSTWALVSGGYSQANTASEVNAYLKTDPNSFLTVVGSSGEFYYRAYLHSDDGTATPLLDKVTVVTASPTTYYLDKTGATAINQIHTDVVNDRYFQYLIRLYSAGDATPIVDDINLEYIKADLTLTSPVGGEIWPIGAQRNITWNKNGMTDVGGKFDETVKVSYSTNGGSDWTEVAANVPNTGTYQWTIPNTHTSTAKVKITSNGWSVLTSESTSNFRIVGTIDLTAPNGAERWVVGSKHNITWTSSGSSQIPNVKLEYSTDNGTTWRDMAGVVGQSTTVANTGTYEWTIPDTITTTESCLVRISDALDAETKDQSAAGFRIIGALNVTFPTLNAALTSGAAYNITWTTTGTIPQVNLTYSVNGTNGPWMDMAGNAGQVTTITNAGTYSWSVPNSLSDTCILRVTDKNNSTVYAESPNFYIRGFQISSPNGNEEWEMGFTHAISWSSGGTIDLPLKIYLSIDGGATYPYWLKQSNTDPGSWLWDISGTDKEGNTYTTSDTCKIKVVDNSNRADTSDANFKILPTPALTVTSPTSSDEWIIGTGSHNITWTTTGKVSSDLAIEYSLNAGTWTAVSPAPTSQQITNKSYAWTIPDVAGVLPANVQIRVRETSVPSGRDTTSLQSATSQTFKITTPTLSITAPTTGTVWVVGDTTRTITWSNVGTLIDNLFLDYSVDGGANWNNIATFTQAQHNGTYDWTNIPSGAAGDSVLMRISDSRTPVSVTDNSDAIKILGHEKVTLTHPSTGETLIQGDSYNITWNWDGQKTNSNLSIRFSTDNGVTWPNVSPYVVETGIPNSPPTFSWTVPNNIDSNQVIMRIYDPADEAEISSFSGAFTITIPQVTITAPASGANWFATGAYNITWATIGSVSNSLKIEYQLDNGTGQVITNATTASEAAAKSKAWAVPDSVGSTCKIRITDNNHPTVSFTTEAFNIIAPTVTITSPTGSESGPNAWVVGTQHAIVWTTTGASTDAISGLRIQYSTTGPSGSFTTITTITDVGVLHADTGTYNWTIPDAASSNVCIKIFDPGRIATTATSNIFEIKAPSLTITSPNTGSESWIIGTPHEITWYSVGSVTTPLKLYYTPDGSTWKQITAFDGVDDGSFTWTVPDDYAPGTASVKITDSYTPIPRADTSDKSFTIALPTITVTTPSNIWSATDDKAVTWTAVGTLIGPYLKVEWSLDNFADPAKTYLISNTVDKSATSVNWTIPESAVGTTVRTRVTDLGRTTVWGKSNAFTVLPIPVITISAPTLADTGANAWRIGKQYTITWSDNGGAISNNLKLQYSVNASNPSPTWTDIATGEANDGSYPWTVPTSASASTDCKIRIYDNVPWKTGTNLSVGSPTFEIAIPRITITSPAGGEFWAVGESPTITWTSDGFINDNLALQYTPDGTNYLPVASGEINDGSHTWTVPDVGATSLARIKILDATADYAGQKVVAISNAFNIIAKPTITVSAPNGGQTYVLGDSLPIIWTSKGISIANVKIEYSADNFGSSTRTIVASTPNIGSYTWIIPDDALSGSTIKIRISMVGDSTVNDTSDANFRIRGGFTVTAPTSGQRYIVNKAETFTWTTKGTIANVKLKYTSDSTANPVVWTTITNSTANNNSYVYTIPEPRSTTAKMRIEDATDATVYAESDNFIVDYYTITWRVLDYDTNAPLQQLKVTDSVWIDQTGTITSPVDHSYPYGAYTTFWSKDGYIERSQEWVADSDKTVTIPLENQITAMVEWHVLLSTSYDVDTDTLKASTWLERRGKLVGTVATDLEGLQSASIDVYDGTTLVKSMTTTTHDDRGVFWFSWESTGLEAGKTYFVKSSIGYRDSTYTSGASVDVTQAKKALETKTLLQAEAVKTTAIKTAVESTLPTEITEARTSVETKVAEARTSVETKVAEVKTETAKILTAAEMTIPAKVEETRALTETAMKSEILNTESTIRTNDTLSIRYRTYTGLAPTIDVYNPDNVLEINKGKMKEIGTTGIYEYPVQFQTGWGRGDFTIVCSESNKGTLDALLMSVITTDIEQVAGQVAAVLGTTAGIATLKEVTDSLNSQFSVIETALSRVGRDLVKEAGESTVSSTALESVYGQLSNIAGQMKQMVGKTSFNIDKLYEVSTEKKRDITYLKNKTQQLKATMELNTKMIDNIANKPVTQTWYEYR